MNQFNRRIVTNGQVFRIECQLKGYGPDAFWSSYCMDFKTLEEAREAMARMNATEDSKWTVVE